MPEQNYLRELKMPFDEIESFARNKLSRARAQGTEWDIMLFGTEVAALRERWKNLAASNNFLENLEEGRLVWQVLHDENRITNYYPENCRGPYCVRDGCRLVTEIAVNDKQYMFQLAPAGIIRVYQKLKVSEPRFIHNIGALIPDPQLKELYLSTRELLRAKPAAKGEPARIKKLPVAAAS